MRRGLVATALLGAVLGAAPFARVAHADDANVQEAGALFKEGVRYFKAGDFERARTKFAAASGLVKSTDILWNLAVAEAKSGHAVDAITHFRAYEHDPKARPGDVREADSKWLPLLEPQVGELQIDGADGAAVRIDGSDAGALPLAAIAVQPGSHRVEAKTGGESVVRDVSVAAGQTIVVHTAGGPQAPAAAVPAVAPSSAPALAPVEPAPPSATTESGAPQTRVESSPARLWVTVGLGVGAVAFAATAVYFGVSANGSNNDITSLRQGLAPGSCPAAAGCATLNSDISQHNNQVTATFVTTGGAVLFGAGALAAWLLLPRDHTVTSGAVVPFFGPGVAGASYAKSF